MTVLNGQRTFNFSIKVPSDKVSEVEKVIKDHASFMQEHHSYDGKDKIHLVHYYVSKADELVNMMDPREGTTGNVNYSINEVYVVPEGIGQHLNFANKWDGMPGFGSVLGKYGCVMVVNGEVIQSL